MAITLKTDKSGLAIIDRARTRKNWSALAAAWCHAANVSLSTLKRFRERKAIQKDSFIAICKAVGIEDWELIVADSVDDLRVVRRRSRQAKKLIVEEVMANLNHLNAQLAFVEQAFAEAPVDAQLQMVRQQVTPALMQEATANYRQLMHQQNMADVDLGLIAHPPRIEVNVSIIQIMVTV